MKKIIYISAMLTFIFSCSPESTETSTYDGSSADATAKAQKGQNQQESLDSPVLTCGTATETSLEITVTAGETGAAGGFDIHWMTEADFMANNSMWSDDLSCAIGFSGNGTDAYSLAPNGSISLYLEDLMAEAECGTLECGVTYVFRVRAKTEGGQGQQGGLNKSDWSEDFRCATSNCVEICTHGKGYWWNHGTNGNPGNQNNEWPVKVMEEGLELGEGAYSAEILGQIYDRNTTGGNGLVSVAHHLITTKLNIANGADATAVADAIVAADEFIGSLNPLLDHRDQSEVGDFKDVLEAYNEGKIGPGNCDDQE